MKTSICACLLALAAVDGMAQAPGEAAAAAAVVANPAPEAAASSTTHLEAALLAADRRPPLKATCTASCGGSSTVSCSGSTCSAVDRDCSVLERGRVTCNGVTTFCPKTCNCDEVCVCAVPCSEPCTSGGGFIQECGSWGICATSCACGGECLQPIEDPRPIPSATQGGACPAPTTGDALRAIFN